MFIADCFFKNPSRKESYDPVYFDEKGSVTLKLYYASLNGLIWSGSSLGMQRNTPVIKLVENVIK